MKLYEIFGIGGNALGFGGGGGGTSLPALSDNGTNVTSTEMIFVPATSSATVAGGIGATTSNGISFNANNVQLIAAGTRLAVAAGGAVQFDLASNVPLAWSNTSNDALGSAADTAIGKVAAASLRIGLGNNATPVANTLTIGESSRGGTDTNVAGANGTLKPGVGTGTGAGNKLAIQRNLMGATGTTAQTVADAIVAGQSKTLSNTSATTTALASISVPSNSGGGCSGFITVVASDGTNFDSETQSFNVSYVNKATVITIGTPVITASTAASNSGSTTIGITATAGTNAVNINVTPVFTTIVPTTVTSYIEIINHGTGNVTIN